MVCQGWCKAHILSIASNGCMLNSCSNSIIFPLLLLISPCNLSTKQGGEGQYQQCWVRIAWKRFYTLEIPYTSEQVKNLLIFPYSKALRVLFFFFFGQHLPMCYQLWIYVKNHVLYFEAIIPYLIFWQVFQESFSSFQLIVFHKPRFEKDKNVGETEGSRFHRSP